MNRFRPRRVSRAVRPLSHVPAPGSGEPTPWFTRGGQALPPGWHGLPESVRVAGQVYHVFSHTRLFADAQGRGELLGGVHFASRLIVIAADQPRAQAHHTLSHEIGHVYVALRSRGCKALAALTDAQIESVCDLVAEVIEDPR